MLCTPLVLYGILAVSAVAMQLMNGNSQQNGQQMPMVRQLAVHATVLAILWLLCSRGHVRGAWVALVGLLLAPLILALFLFIVMSALAIATA